MIGLIRLLADSNVELRVSPGAGIVGLACLAFGIYICVDAGKYPDTAFQAVGSKRSTWQIWPVVGGLCCGIVAIVMGIIWLTSKKAQVEAAAGPGGAGGMAPPPPPMSPPPAPPVG